MDQSNTISNDADAAIAAKRKAEANLVAGYDVAAAAAAAPPAAKRPKSSEEEEAKRNARLESNRKAARESRRRKKVLVEELQRSVIFFTRANAQLKQKNEGLEAMLFAARSQIEGGGGSGGGGGGQQSIGAVTAPSMATIGMQDTTDLQEHKHAPQAPTVAAPTATPPTAAPANQQVQQQQHQAHGLPMVQNNQNIAMANWLAMAQATAGMVPNPMAMSLPSMGMFNPAAMSMANGMAAAANPAAAAGLIGMAAAGMGHNPFLGQLQQAAAGQLQVQNAAGAPGNGMGNMVQHNDGNGSSAPGAAGGSVPAPTTLV